MTLKILFQSITKKEWQLIILFSLILAVVTSIPHFYRLLNTPAQYGYTWVQEINPLDTRVYFSYIEQVKQGNFLFKNLYTHETQSRMILNPFWLGVGLLAKIFNLEPPIAFQVIRILLIFPLLTSLYFFISYFFANKGKRKLTFFLLCFSSGLGALVFSFSKMTLAPIDLWIPEASTFFLVYNSPHFIASLGLITLVFLLFLLALENNIIKYSIYAGLSGLLLFLFHPFHVPLVFGVLGIYSLALFFKTKKTLWYFARHYLIFLLLSIPSLLYYLFLLAYNPITFWVTSQNICKTPNFMLIVMGYGVLFPLALLGLYILLRYKKVLINKYLFLVLWLPYHLILIYIPLNFQRRFTEGLNLIITILASIGLFYLFFWLKNKINPQKFNIFINNPILWFFIFAIFFASTNITLLVLDIKTYSYSTAHIYISKQKFQAARWLKENLSENDTILSGPYTGNLIPSISARTVYFGHGIETIFSKSKLTKIKWFWGHNKNDLKKIEFLKDNSIDYIFSGDEEKSLGNFLPQEKKYLQKVYQNNEIEIYKVIL